MPWLAEQFVKEWVAKGSNLKRFDDGFDDSEQDEEFEKDIGVWLGWAS